MRLIQTGEPTNCQNCAPDEPEAIGEEEARTKWHRGQPLPAIGLRTIRGSKQVNACQLCGAFKNHASVNCDKCKHALNEATAQGIQQERIRQTKVICSRLGYIPNTNAMAISLGLGRDRANAAIRAAYGPDLRADRSTVRPLDNEQ